MWWHYVWQHQHLHFLNLHLMTFGSFSDHHTIQLLYVTTLCLAKLTYSLSFFYPALDNRAMLFFLAHGSYICFWTGNFLFVTLQVFFWWQFHWWHWSHFQIIKPDSCCLWWCSFWQFGHFHFLNLYLMTSGLFSGHCKIQLLYMMRLHLVTSSCYTITQCLKLLDVFLHLLKLYLFIFFLKNGLLIMNFAWFYSF